jgi:uncharacterized protein (TIGR02217 family)
MAFYEERFPDNVSYGVTGGPNWLTLVTNMLNGNMQSIQKWEDARHIYDASHALRSPELMASIKKFFMAARGRLHGFRFKDWTDYTIAADEGIMGEGVGTGEPVYDLYKRYDFGTLPAYDRRIHKLVTDGSVMPFVAYRNDNPLTIGVSAGNISVNANTGQITFVADSTKNIDANSTKAITGISQANPGSVTCVGHGFSTGDKIKITSVGGMTQVNNLYFTITVSDADHFTIGVNTTGYGAYTSGGSAIKYGITQTSPVRVNAAAHGRSNGDIVYLDNAAGMTNVNDTAFTVSNAQTNYFELSAVDGTAYSAYTGSGVIYMYPQPSDELTFKSEFDVPVQFGMDNANLIVVGPSSHGCEGIQLIEIKNP